VTTQPKRVMLIDDDATVLGVVGDLLHAGGYAVQLLLYPTLAVPTAKTFRPDVVLADLHMPVMTGREVLHSFKAFDETRDVPVVLFTSTWTPGEMMRSFLAGAVDLWTKPLVPDHVDRLGELLTAIDELPQSKRALGRERLRSMFLRYHAQEKSHGTLLLNPGTPFEGRVILDKGQFSFARLGPIYGEPALDEMLTLDDGVWRWDADVIVPPSNEPPPATAAAGYVPKVLLVDDDAAVRKLVTKQLERAGFKVETAEHGEDGQRKALTLDLDAVIADLNMPVLDGWGMLRALKAELRTREIPVLVLSAHDDYRETLAAARAGAHDYLRKTGHSDELVKRVKQLTAARVRVRELLEKAKPIKRLEVSLVGAQWLMRTLSELDCTAVVDAEDDWGNYRIRVDRGQLREVTAQADAKQLSGQHALTAFLVSRGAMAHVSFEMPPPSEPAPPWLSESIDEALRHLQAMEARVLGDRLAKVGGFTVDAELAGLFARIGSESEVALLRAVAEEKVAPAALAQHLGLDAERVREGLRELVRRGVLRLS